MITPKPKTIVELFEGHPERWQQHKLYNTEQSCFCLMGAVEYIYGNYTDKSERILGFLHKSCDPMDFISWNDAPERTFEEVLAKCKELGI